MTRDLAWITDRATGELLAVAVIELDRSAGIIRELPRVSDDQEIHVAGVQWATATPA